MPVLGRSLAVAAAAIITIAAGHLIVAAAGKPDTAGGIPHAITVTATAVSNFGPATPGTIAFGKLRFLGGLVLTSADKGFGGYSGLCMDVDGGRLLAISDAGSWLTSKLEWTDGRITGLSEARIGPLLGEDGAVLPTSSDRDAEAVTLAGGTLGKGEVLIAFEQHHRLQRFPINLDGVGAPTAGIGLPDYAARLKPNRGFESVTILEGGAEQGSVLMFTEGRIDSRGFIRGWLLGSGKPRPIYLKQLEGFDVTGLAALPDGGLIVLERRYRFFEGVRMRLRRIAAADIKAGAALDGDVLMQADSRFQIDNMEGLSVTPGASGETIITLISDDNFSFFQRTLLLQFALPKPVN